MSLLTIVTYFCQRTNIPVPSSVMGSTDEKILQLKALLEEEGIDLAKRGQWQGLVNEASLTTTATEDQGAIATIASNGFDYIRNQTIWDRSSRLPIVGPLDGQEWQMLKASVSTGPRYQFRMRGGHLLINPVPTAGLSWYFEYYSKNWILGADGVTYKQFFTSDTDNPLLSEDLMISGLRWRWKKEKGFDYAEDFRTYEMQIKDAIGRDGSKPILKMDVHAFRGPQPGIFIPQGSWSLP
jgi:hypothetical protein